MKTGDKIFILVMTFFGATALGVIAFIFSAMVIIAFMGPSDVSLTVGLVVGIIVSGLFFLKTIKML